MFTIYRTLQCIVVKYGPYIFWNHKYPNYIYIYRVTWSSWNSRLWGDFPTRWCLWLKRFKTGFFSSSSNYWQTLGEIDQWLLPTGQMDKSYWKCFCSYRHSSLELISCMGSILMNRTTTQFILLPTWMISSLAEHFRIHWHLTITSYIWGFLCCWSWTMLFH